MKQKRLISLIGTICLFINVLFIITGCPTGQDVREQQNQQNQKKERIFTVTYDLSGCTYASFTYSNDWKLKPQTVKEGEEVTLAKDGSESSSGKPWKIEYVKHKDSKLIQGWSKSKNGEILDYAFGEKVKPTGDMTLYPALSKYGIGDVIDGKTIIYVRHGKKDKIQTSFFLDGEYTEYNVIGENWRYIAVDVDAAKASEKRMWATSAKNIPTSDGIGAGKENTEKIIAEYSGDTEANNAAKYCRSISIHGHLPSVAETYLIFNAIRSKTIKGIPTSSQIAIGGTPQLRIYTALFWSSTQENTNNAYALNMSTEDLITGGKIHGCDKAHYSQYDVFVCPVIYYNDAGKAVN